MHCLWCTDHRLNLVARDFKDVPIINFVIMFIDWVTARDRLVSYTAFVRANPDFPKKKKSHRHRKRADSSTGMRSRLCSTKPKRSMRF